MKPKIDKRAKKQTNKKPGLSRSVDAFAADILVDPRGSSELELRH